MKESRSRFTMDSDSWKEKETTLSLGTLQRPTANDDVGGGGEPRAADTSIEETRATRSGVLKRDEVKTVVAPKVRKTTLLHKHQLKRRSRGITDV